MRFLKHLRPAAGRASILIALISGATAFTPAAELPWVKGVTFTLTDSPAEMEQGLREVRDMGADTIRTWGVGRDTPALLDAAQRNGLRVLLGLWLEHGRDGNEGDGDLNYASHSGRMDTQTEKVLADVRRYKDHPALIGWGVGNEVILNISSEEQKTAYAKYLEGLVRKIKEIDPEHPVISVSAWTISVPYWERHTPSLDGYGINAYGASAAAIPDALREAGASKPYWVTEFGPRGEWDSPKDDNGVAREPTDAEKYDHIVTGWRDWIEANRERGCRGAFVFNFGDDWAPTSFWLDFYVKGQKRPAYWATREAFTGKAPPSALELGRLQGMMVSPTRAAPETWLGVGLEPLDGESLKEVAFYASPDRGDRHRKNQILPLEVKPMRDRLYRVKAPSEPGVYKLYAMTGGKDLLRIACGSVTVERTHTGRDGTPYVDRAAAAPDGTVVRIEGDAASGYRLMRNGQPWRIRGAGGSQHLDVLKAAGGNTIRTWGVGPDTDGILREAAANGIAVTLGIWLGHERHGFDYSDPEDLEKQRRHVREAVMNYKDHPALLTWGLGNEMEGIQSRGDNPAIWREINHLAAMIKELDPNHPVMTVVANVNPDKVRAIQDHAPEIDILGVNAYAGAAGIGGALHAAGWTKPYCVTEYGLPGPWEVEHTDWNAPIEPTSREKAGYYFVTTREIMKDEKQCLGAYAFLWGHKQEATSSWFGMFLPSGEKTPRVDAISRAWTGEWPANRAPVLKEADLPVSGKRVNAGETFSIRARYADPDGDTLTYTWQVYRESTDRKVGGDEEAKPEALPGLVRSTDAQGGAVLTTPRESGAYRVFVTVKDGKGSGCMDNWPFLVK